jgi:hypothetical protein
MDLYRRLPSGWQTTPEGTPTDLYMWQQILAVAGCRAVSGLRPTVLHFPSPDRVGRSTEERLSELDAWVPRLSDPELERTLVAGLLETTALDAIELEESRAAMEQTLADVDDHRTRLNVQLREVDEERAALSRRLEELEAQLRRVHQELAWLSDRSLRARLGRFLRGAGASRARPAAPEETAPPRPAPTPAAAPRPATGSPAPDRPSDTPARPQDPSTR